MVIPCHPRPKRPPQRPYKCPRYGVNVADATDIARCDFCMVGNPKQVFVVTTKVMLIEDILSTGEWSACGQCLWDLEHDDYGAVFDRWIIESGYKILETVPEKQRDTMKFYLRKNIYLIWDIAWGKRISVAEATTNDKLDMVKNLEKFRRDTPDRLIP